MDWTINGSTDPDQCNQSVASDIDILVTTPTGTTVADFVAPCRGGITTIPLDPGSYAASAALIDRAGSERTTRLQINPFVIYRGTDLSIGVDFPASSFR